MANDAQPTRKIKDDDNGSSLERRKKDPESAVLKETRLNARTYKTLFKSIRRQDALRDAASPPSSGSKRHNYVETCTACSKRKRLECDSRKQEVCSCNKTLNKDPCGTSIPKRSTASSPLKFKIVRKKSPVPTNPIFGNNEEEKRFLYCTKNLKGSDSSKGSLPAAQDATKELFCARVSSSAAFNDQDLKLAVEDRLENQESADEQVLFEKEMVTKYTVADKDVQQSIKNVHMKCEKVMEETEEFSRVWEGKKTQLEKDHRIESVLIRSIYAPAPARKDKLKKLDIEFAKKLEDLKCQKDKCLKELQASQLAERNKRQKVGARRLAAKSLEQVELVGQLPSNALRGSVDGSDNMVSVDLLSEEQIPNAAPISTPEQEVPLEMPETALSEIMASANSIQSGTSVESMGENDRRHETDIITSGTRDLNEAAAYPKNADILSVELSSIKSTSILPVITPVQGRQLPQDLALQDDGSQLSTSTVKRDEDAMVSGCEDNVQQVEISSLCQGDNGLIVQNTNEAPTNEPVAELQPSPSNCLSVGCSQPDLLRVHGAEHQICSEGDTSPQNTEAPSRLVEDLEFSTPALQDEGSQLLTCTGRQDGDALASGNKDNVQVEIPALCQADNGLNIQITNKEPRSEPVAELPPSSSNHLSIGCSQPDVLQAHVVERQTCAGGHISGQKARAPSQLVEDPTEVSSHSVLHPGATLELHPPMNATTLPLGLNQLDVISASRVDNQASSERCTQTTEAPPHLFEHTSELPSQVFLQPCASLELHPPFNTPISGFIRHLSVPITSPVAPGLPSLPLYADPLQMELQRLCKEQEQALKVHEDTKQLLRSSCEEEIIQIRRKYEAKLQDAETSFLLKKKEFDRNHNMVLRNKIIAEAFRQTVEMQQVAPSSIAQDLHQLLSQPALRPSQVTGSPLLRTPATSQKTTLPPVQVVHHASALFSSTPSRPPNISSILPRTGNHQVSQIRSPAPHLQSCRPSTNIALFPSRMSSQHVLSELPTTSHPIRQLPPHPTPSSCQMPALSNYPSSLELLIDIDNLFGASFLNSLPPR